MFIATASKTENSITKFISDAWRIISNFFVSIYDTLVRLLEPAMGETAAGLFVLAAGFLIIILVLLRIINK